VDQITQIVAEIGVAGAVDILLMTVLVYGALALLQNNRMRVLLRGVVTVVALYLAARLFELELTATSLETVLAIVGIASVVLYGPEIRRLVERMALFRPGQAKPASSERLTLLAKVMYQLGSKRVGALVVIEGLDAVDDLISGGVILDGDLSEPLLESLFDPNTIGHDGALILRSGRVWRFACHLPLSDDHEELGHRGTRHAAALGLSEKCDALCIAVSEERGTVTVAQNGSLHTVPEEAALIATIEASPAHTVHRNVQPSTWRVRPLTVMAALLISILSWLIIVHGGRPVERTYELEVNASSVPAELELQAVYPKTVRVTVTGAGHAFYLVTKRSLKLLLPLEDTKPGQQAITIDAAKLELPNGVDFVSSEPARVSVSIIPRRPAP
jgi:uncharacterized protein (TIGR00159 family)